MIYFLWAFLFGALGVSVMMTSLQNSYRPILKFAAGILSLFFGLWCILQIDMPMKYNYGKKIIRYVKNATHTGTTSFMEYFDRYTTKIRGVAQ